jgi:cell wall-associated NlpC family hydrolase
LKVYYFLKGLHILNKNHITSNSIYVINDSIVDVFKSSNTNSERVTQTLFCQQVIIKKEILKWSKVQVVDGYIGWIKSDKIDKTFANITDKKVIIKSKLKNIYSAMNGTSPIKEITLGTELYSINKKANWYEVNLPMNTTGWIEDTDTLQIQTGTHIPKTTGIEFVETAKKFLEVPYLWGGVGAWGIDCSGLTYICCRVNGVDLPRDAQPQYDAIPTSVAPTITDMKPGDLVFFSSKIGSKMISHVGIYIGNNEFIHSSSSVGFVAITSLLDAYFIKRLVGVKRVFET